MTVVPEHIEATVVATTTYRCHRCGARLILGNYPDNPGHAAELLTDWLARHGHDQEPPP